MGERLRLPRQARRSGDEVRIQVGGPRCPTLPPWYDARPAELWAPEDEQPAAHHHGFRTGFATIHGTAGQLTTR